MSDRKLGWENRNNLLKVKMFGEFSMSFRGKPLTDGRVRETHFISMMQILLHNRKTGVSRDFLEEVLFGDRESKDVHHLMQSVVYNAKKKLRSWGLPDVNYIALKKEVFYWNEEIPVEEDAEEFDRLCQEARASEDPDRKLSLYLEAAHTYGGEFLSTYAGLIWAASEARRYWKQFCECIDCAADMLRERQDYLELEKLGKYAAKASPFSDWEVLTMEALVSMGCYEEARDFYVATSDLYMDKMGIRPCEKLIKMMRKLSGEYMYSYDILDNIQGNLDEGEEELQKGYLCSYPVFQGIYQVVSRMLERSGQPIYLMLCTVVDSYGNPLKDQELLERVSEHLGEVICRSVRHGDAVNRYGLGQYLVLLINTTRENCEVVQGRITQNFQKNKPEGGIDYQVSSIIQ